MIRFENMHRSPMRECSPAWQEAIIKRVETEYQDAALKASEEFETMLKELMPRIQPGYYGCAIAGLYNRVHRYVYIKGIEGSGAVYDAQIDLLLHTVCFVEHDE